MFANISHADKLAVFALLDEYFESRPHLAPQQPSTTSQSVNVPIPSRSQISSGLTAVQSHLNRSSGPVSSSTTTSTTTTTNGASSPWASALSNKHVQGMVGKALGSSPSSPAATSSNAKSPPPPPAQSSKTRAAGSAGLVQSKTFGHVDTSSGLGAFKTMFKDPQAAPKPYEPPARTSPASSLPPPPTRRVIQPEPEPEQEPEAESDQDGDYAEALYDFAGNEPGDLPLQRKQVVLVLEKTSPDWWKARDAQTGQEGLIPAAYVKEI
ncbi:Tyrosine kinases [Phaffia rhodozyma]|uniref:Tyrosine kinases n=1 Tax=Phaffia rhodozyma TaxID=264483 RepID=A0A0F7SIE6_PHARH|nr:Tyrosine kinases [Phaffia rhodozyma]